MLVIAPAADGAGAAGTDVTAGAKAVIVGAAPSGARGVASVTPAQFNVGRDVTGAPIAGIQDGRANGAGRGSAADGLGPAGGAVAPAGPGAAGALAAEGGCGAPSEGEATAGRLPKGVVGVPGAVGTGAAVAGVAEAAATVP